MSDAMMRRAIEAGGSEYDSSKDPYWEKIQEGETYTCLCFAGPKYRNQGCKQICGFAGDPDYEPDGDWYKPAWKDAVYLHPFRSESQKKSERSGDSAPARNEWAILCFALAVVCISLAVALVFK